MVSIRINPFSTSALFRVSLAKSFTSFLCSAMSSLMLFSLAWNSFRKKSQVTLSSKNSDYPVESLPPNSYM